MKKERRRNTRIAANFDVLVTAGSKAVALKTRNLSLRGMECPSMVGFRQGGHCRVTFILSPKVSFSVEGEFVRAGKQHSGIVFTSIDSGGFYHLKRLVQYNAADPDAIDAELAGQLHPAAQQ